MRLVRHRADGKRQVLNTRVKNGSLECYANQNSILEVFVVLGAALLGKSRQPLTESSASDVGALLSVNGCRDLPKRIVIECIGPNIQIPIPIVLGFLIATNVKPAGSFDWNLQIHGIC